MTDTPSHVRLEVDQRPDQLRAQVADAAVVVADVEDQVVDLVSRHGVAQPLGEGGQGLVALVPHLVELDVHHLGVGQRLHPEVRLHVGEVQRDVADPHRVGPQLAAELVMAARHGQGLLLALARDQRQLDLAAEAERTHLAEHPELPHGELGPHPGPSHWVVDAAILRHAVEHFLCRELAEA